MSTPTLVINETLLDGEDMSSNITSDYIDLSGIDGFCVHSQFTGSPVGVLEIKASNDQNLTPVSIDSYNVSAAGTRLVNVEIAKYKWLIITYTKTSGTGALTCVVSGKNS